jgi:error-prone DNA polymerase
VYAELHCHSVFSLLDGASEPEALVARAKALGYPALALTDHNDLGGAVRFAQAATELGVGGIIGAELTVDVGGGEHALTHLVLLAQTRQGYGNISTLITRARMNRPRGEPAVSLDTLAQHAQGIFALTGCLRGWVPTLVAAGDAEGACEAAAALKDIFGGRLAIECWDHHLPEEREVVRQLIPLARSLGVRWVVTNDVHYAHPTGRLAHDVLASIKHQETLDGMGTRLKPNGEWYLKSAAQLRRRWQHDETGLRTSVSIAEQCTFRLADLEPTLPGFPLPPGVTADEYLTRLVEQGAVERWGIRTSDVVALDDLPEAYRTQIAHELDIIRRLGLAGYFLIVWDIIRFAHREGVLCQGRGSAANSAVCYCLGITAVDPIGLKLLFERFLSEERREPPDIDIDFAHRDREKVLQYVYERYGREHAAMVCEHITYRGRSAVRDAARVLGFSVEQADVLSAFSDRFSAKATADALRGGASPEEMTARKVDIDPQSDRPADPNDARREPEAWSADVLLAERLGQGMVRGTEATTRMREAKAQARQQVKEVAARDAAARSGRPELTRKRAAKEQLTAADRPLPNAAYEPYGSPNARSTRGPRSEVRGPSGNPVDPRPSVLDPDSDLGPRSSDLPSVLAHAGLDPNDKRVQALPDIVAGLHNAPRHRSIHVGGFVLTAEPLSTVVPIEPASMPGRTVIQWERDDLDPVGLVKIDLLGLGMLTVLQDCLKYIRATRGQTIDLGQLDMNDQAVYDDICAADTIGVFQVESRAQMNTLPRLKPRNFYDLVVEVAIIRPGPIQGEMVHPYLRRRAGEEKVTYPHPAMAPILDRTLGVPLFQEQGMQVAIALAGFTPGEADNLRRAMGHKRSRERMAAICEKLIAGMKKNGIDDDVARRIYNQINAFADYGFPESHAASFALIVYASAYLRHYFAPEFTAAILNAQPMGFYSVGTLIEDARRHGVIVNPVDLTRSGWDHSLERAEGRGPRAGWAETGAEDRGVNHARPSALGPRPSNAPAVRLGLRLVKGLGHAAREELDRVLADGPFADIDDVVRRVKLDERTFRALAEAGAFDNMVPDVAKGERRRVALWRVLDAVRGDAGPLAPRRVIPTTAQPKLPSMSPLEITDADYRMTSLSLNGHPMRHLRKVLTPNGVRTARDILKSGRDGEKVAHAGLVICRQRPGTAKGFVFLSLEDETGIVNVVVTPKRFERQALMISTSPLILVRGTLQVEQTVVNLRGESFQALRADAGEAWAKGHNFH